MSDRPSDRPVEDANPAFSSADITALAHLYRGEVYRSTVWRTRLDATTNWAVLTTGIALSLTFSSESASPLPLVVVGLLVATFLGIEARRYRFFDFWRMRAHIFEVYFFGPILGAILVTYLQLGLTDVTTVWQLYFGFIFSGIVMFAPGGIAGLQMKPRPLVRAGSLG